MILLMAATNLEIPLFINDEHKKTDVLITGVGAPSAMYHLQKRLQQIDYDLVIQAGIAGAFSTETILGETVIVKQDTFGDIGMEEKKFFKTVFQSGFADENEFPYEQGWLVNKNKMIYELNLRKVKAVTINKVTDDDFQKDQLINLFNPVIETMEGAALHYVCLQENVPFIQLRSISNYVGERDKTKWKMKDAIINLNGELSKIVDSLNG